MPVCRTPWAPLGVSPRPGAGLHVQSRGAATVCSEPGGHRWGSGVPRSRAVYRGCRAPRRWGREPCVPAGWTATRKDKRLPVPLSLCPALNSLSLLSHEMGQGEALGSWVFQRAHTVNVALSTLEPRTRVSPRTPVVQNSRQVTASESKATAPLTTAIPAVCQSALCCWHTPARSPRRPVWWAPRQPHPPAPVWQMHWGDHRPPKLHPSGNSECDLI